MLPKCSSWRTSQCAQALLLVARVFNSRAMGLCKECMLQEGLLRINAFIHPYSHRGFRKLFSSENSTTPLFTYASIVHTCRKLDAMEKYGNQLVFPKKKQESRTTGTHFVYEFSCTHFLWIKGMRNAQCVPWKKALNAFSISVYRPMGALENTKTYGT